MTSHQVPYIDFHTHSMWNDAEIKPIEVISVHGLQEKSNEYYTFGYHPWWTMEPLNPGQLAIMEAKYKDDENCLGLGEFGLDNLKGPMIEIQEDIFAQQIKIANKVQAPVIIHCVRAFDRLLRHRKQYGKTDWAVHGFVRNKTLAQQILDSGMYISVAPNEVMSPTFQEMLQYIPLNRTFIETDSDFSMDIKSRYAIFAEIRNLSVDHLKLLMYQNFVKFYKDKWQHHIG